MQLEAKKGEEVGGRKKEKDRKEKRWEEEETKGSYPDWKRQNYLNLQAA